MTDYVPLELCDVTPDQAFEFVQSKHRHHHRPVNGMFYKGIIETGGLWLRGVVIVNRPASRVLDDGKTLEVTRLCVDEGLPNACSMLYAWARRQAIKAGYQRLITYILESEPGTSLLASGWVCTVERTSGGSWNRPSRPRKDRHPLAPKQRWEASMPIPKQ